jgi:hypothetical protein
MERDRGRAGDGPWAWRGTARRMSRRPRRRSSCPWLRARAFVVIARGRGRKGRDGWVEPRSLGYGCTMQSLGAAGTDSCSRSGRGETTARARGSSAFPSDSLFIPALSPTPRRPADDGRDWTALDWTQLHPCSHSPTQLLGSKCKFGVVAGAG